MKNLKVGLTILGIIGAFVVGIIMGFILQQMIMMAIGIEIAEAFEGKIDVDVDFNETALAEGIASTVKPLVSIVANSSYNHPVVLNFTNCTPVRCEGNSNQYCMECKR